MTPTVSKIKKTGATFTPSGLANFLATKLISLAKGEGKANLTVLDPACGDGSLLYAINEVGKGVISNLVGYDTNQKYIENAKALLVPDTKQLELSCRDFLAVCPNNIDLFCTNYQHEFVDMVIANPPYVRTQVLGAEKAQQLARDFNLSGRVDLYYPFLMAMTNALRKGGMLGVITSNRFLSTKSGGDIRRFLLENYDILEVIDLGDTKLFNAAVLPAIFIGRKKADKKAISKQVAEYTSIYEKEDKEGAAVNVASIYEILNSKTAGHFSVNGIDYTCKRGLLKHSSDKSGVWQMSNREDNAWVETINKNASFRIKDRFKVRVGVKSCADNVFICQKWEEAGICIEKELLKPMISQENMEAWHINKDSMKSILYPHYSVDGKRKVFDLTKYPNAASYLASHRKQLESRTYLIKSGRTWYEYWVPQNPALWNLPKVVFPDISVKPRFCYDDSGAVVNGNCYWICARTEEERQLLLLVEGVANSEVMIKYHDLCFNNKLYSGRRRYLTQYIEQYPMPNPQSDYAQDILKLVAKINLANDISERENLAKLINAKVKLAFGVMD